MLRASSTPLTKPPSFALGASGCIIPPRMTRSGARASCCADDFETQEFEVSAFDHVRFSCSRTTGSVFCAFTDGVSLLGAHGAERSCLAVLQILLAPYTWDIFRGNGVTRIDGFLVVNVSLDFCSQNWCWCTSWCLNISYKWRCAVAHRNRVSKMHRWFDSLVCFTIHFLFVLL